MAEDYCELCDLPLSTCVHGNPPAPPPPTAPRTPTVRGSRATGSSTSRTAAAPPPPRPSRVTSTEAFRPHILAVLHDAGGALEADAVMERLAERMDDVLLERDRQVAPGGEVRWQTSARKARKTMIDEGLVVPARPGVWELTERGEREL